MQILAYIATRPEVQKQMQAEVDAATRAGTASGRPVGLPDRTAMPYTEAVILESIRLIASPIVPHVANQDSSIAGKSQESNQLL